MDIKIKNALQNKLGYDFESEFFTDEILTLVDEVIDVTKEQTGVAELLEALIALRKWAIVRGNIDIDGKLIINADNAINKATK
jgi:hypothetical protein